MVNLDRNEGGKFLAKGDQVRQVRTLRLTDNAWKNLGIVADQQGLSRADLIEQFAQGLDVRTRIYIYQDKPRYLVFAEILEILEFALTLKANAGGKIKAEIRKAVSLICDSNSAKL